MGDSRTAIYWFMRFVSIVRMFIRAERIGIWDLHIKAFQDILPYLLPLDTVTTHNVLTFIYKRVAICMDVLGKLCQMVC